MNTIIQQKRIVLKCAGMRTVLKSQSILKWLVSINTTIKITVEIKNEFLLDIVIHPEKSPESKLHDIAIIILDKVPPYTDFIRPICLPESIDDISFKKGKLYVAGWGWISGCK